MNKLILQRACLAIRWGVGAMFIYAGCLKFLDTHAFAAAVDNFHILPWPMVAGTAVILPVLEILAGLLWIINLWARSAGIVIFSLCGIFSAVLAGAMIRGLEVACGCFGAVGGDSVGWALFRAVVLLSATAFWLIFSKTSAAFPFPASLARPYNNGAALFARLGLFAILLSMMRLDAEASVSLSVQFGELYQADGSTRAPVGSVAMLVADTGGNGVSDPAGLLLAAGQTFGGDNVILAVAAVAAEESTAGLVRHVDFGLINFNYPGSSASAPLAVGTKLWLFWFPSLSPGAIVPGGAAYGFYRSDSIQPGSESTTAFVTPPDGGTYRLAAFTDSVYSALQKTVPATGKILPIDFAASRNTTSSSEFDSWLAGFFNAEEISNPLLAGSQADPDGDGIRNLIEYALGLNPRQKDDAHSRPSPVLSTDRATMSYSYPVAKGLSDVVISPEMSISLISWSGLIDGKDGVSKSIVSRDSNTDLITWTIPVPAPGNKMFLRLKVSKP